MSVFDRIAAKRKERKVIVSYEVAEQQVADFMDYYNIDIEQLESNEDETIEKTYAAILKEITYGKLSIETKEGGYPVIIQKFENGGEFVYKKITHAVVKAKAKYKTDDEKILAILGKLSGEGFEVMAALEGTDRMTAFRAGILFLPAV